MTFPIDLHLFGHTFPSHTLMEIAGYGGGFQLFLWLRRRQRTAAQPTEKMLWMIVGAVFGAVVGSKLLAWVESPRDYFPHWREPLAWLGGKTIVGGLLGGWVGVEIAKARLGVRTATGDPYVFPLIFGMAVGRVGCFLTGLPDHTYGNFSRLPWAVNFGDGPRHPTQLYDIVFLALLAIVLSRRMQTPFENGRIFRLFLGSYLAYRLCLEFIKPAYRPYLGLSAIQIASLVGAVVCSWQLHWRQTTMAPAMTRVKPLVYSTPPPTDTPGQRE